MLRFRAGATVWSNAASTGLIALFLSLVGLASRPVAGGSFTLSHDQKTLQKEDIGDIPNQGTVGSSSVSLTITNSTGVTWTDYTFFISSLSGGIVTISSITIPASPFLSGSVSKDLQSATYFDGSLANGQSFTATINVTSLDTSVHFAGTPSVPEPGTFLLMLIGMSGVGLWRMVKPGGQTIKPGGHQARGSDQVSSFSLAAGRKQRG